METDFKKIIVKAKTNIGVIAVAIPVITTIAVSLIQFLVFCSVKGKSVYYGVTTNASDISFNNIFFNVAFTAICLIIIVFNYLNIKNIILDWKKNDSKKRIKSILKSFMLLLISSLISTGLFYNSQCSLWLNIVLNLFGIIISLGVAAYIFKETKKTVNEIKGDFQKEKNGYNIFWMIIGLLSIILTVLTISMFSMSYFKESAKRNYEITNDSRIIISENNSEYITAKYSIKNNSFIIDTRNVKYISKVNTEIEKIYLKPEINKIIKK